MTFLRRFVVCKSHCSLARGKVLRPNKWSDFLAPWNCLFFAETKLFESLHLLEHWRNLDWNCVKATEEMMVCWKHGRELYGSWRGYNRVAEFGLTLTITASSEVASTDKLPFLPFLPSVLYGTTWIRSVLILVSLQELGWVLGQQVFAPSFFVLH